VRKLGLAEAIDRRLHLLQIHLPYHESDHVLNLAYNALCDGTCLEDIELRRKAFSTVQRLVMENAFVAPLAFQFELVAMNKKVQGYRPNLLGKPKYDDVWLES